MRTLIIVSILVLAFSAGCAVRAVGGVEPAFADHIDPTIAAERSWTPIALRWHGYHEVISINFGNYETWLASLAAADRIPEAVTVTEVVPSDVLDRLDARQIAQR